MKILELKQGSPEWHAVRAKHFTASEAPAMLGFSKYMSRNELLRQKKTGITPEVDGSKQALFDRGHAAEATARAIAEEWFGDDLYPATGIQEVEGLPLLASFDGVTMDESQIWEHKLYNAKLAEYIATYSDLPDTHWPQLEHQLLVSGAESCLFMVSDGTKDNCGYVTYTSKPERRARLIAGWKQFVVDLETYQPEEIKVDPVKAVVESLPAVFVQVQGSLTCQDNISAFAKELQAFIERVPVKPESDDDFAVCEAAVKTLEKAESALKAAKDSSLGYVQSLADLHRMIDTQAEIARSNRLRFEKLVKAEKENRRIAIVNNAQFEFRSFVSGLKYVDYLPALNADFAGAIKGLKTISSIKNAVDTTLANAKSLATRTHDAVAQNVEFVMSHPEHAFLFRDLRDLVLKDADFVELTVKTRIEDHKAAEAKRLEAERERIRAEEQAKAERAAALKAEEERKAEERTLLAAQQVAQEPVIDPVQEVKPAVSIVPPVGVPPTLTLGKIGTRLGFSLSADFLRNLGFEPAGRERAAMLYHEADFPRICTALVNHINNIALRKAA